MRKNKIQLSENESDVTFRRFCLDIYILSSESDINLPQPCCC